MSNKLIKGCEKCGECCGSLLPLTCVDLARIRNLVEKKNLKPLQKDDNFTCPFLTDDNLCSIYKDRPLICKMWKCKKNHDEPLTEEDMEHLQGARITDMFSFFSVEDVKKVREEKC